MRRFLAFVIVLVLALAGFYVAWPAWTGHQIRQAIEANDPAALAQRIDFDQVRARTKPLVAEQMRQSLDQIQKQAGPIGAALTEKLRASIGGNLASAAIDAALTPENVLRLAREGKDIGRILKDVAKSRRAGDGTDAPAGGPAPSTTGTPQPQTAPAEPRHKLTLSNIKSYRITGPLEIAVGVAHDPAAASPDVVVELAFDGWGWKVVGLVPQF
jgi:hypothetical protein